MAKNFNMDIVGFVKDVLYGIGREILKIVKMVVIFCKELPIYVKIIFFGIIILMAAVILINLYKKRDQWRYVSH